MIVQNAWNSAECYTYQNWAYHDICINFSRLYFVLDGEGYYEENGKETRLKRNYLYLTPVGKPYSLYENPDDKLLRCYTHVRIFPPVDHFTEICVEEGSPLFDAVELWRRHINTDDNEVLSGLVQLILSCIRASVPRGNSAAERTKEYLDGLSGTSLSMKELCNALGYSREHVTRSFQATYYMTPKQYFDRRVMNIALEELKNGARVYEVAEALNYSSAYAFSKAFKKKTGMSPEKYVKTYLKTE